MNRMKIIRRPIAHVLAVLPAITALLLAGCAPTSAPQPSSSAVDPAGDTLADLIDLPAETPTLEIQEPTAAPGFSTSQVSYISDGLTITGVLHVPDGPGPFPGVVLLHGFVDPASYTTGSEMPREQERLAVSGNVVLVPDLRGLAGSDEDPRAFGDLEMGWTLDAVNAQRALADSGIPSLDPSRIASIGHSLGGLVALNAAVVAPEDLAALVLIAPSGTDLWANVNQFLAPGDPVYEAIIEQHGTPDAAPEHWAELSPLTFADRINAPVLIVQGTADDMITRDSTEATLAGLQAAGIDPQVVWVEGADHVLDPEWETGAQHILDFLSATLAG